MINLILFLSVEEKFFVTHISDQVLRSIELLVRSDIVAGNTMQWKTVVILSKMTMTSTDEIYLSQLRR